jgi:hypothetical protein
MIDTVRELIETHDQLRVPASILTPDTDLYAVGLTPFAAIRLIIAPRFSRLHCDVAERATFEDARCIPEY